MTTPRAARARWQAAHTGPPPAPQSVAVTRLWADPAMVRRCVAVGASEETVRAVLRTLGVGLCDDAGRAVTDPRPAVSTPVLDTFVPGHPKPQGSKTQGQTADGRVYMRESGGTAHGEWRNVLWKRLRSAWGFRPSIPEACAWSLVFVMPLPAREQRKAGHPHITTPDLDKLIRAVGDACTDAGIVTDDKVLSQMREPTLKRYAHRGEQPGVHVRIWVLD